MNYFIHSLKTDLSRSEVQLKVFLVGTLFAVCGAILLPYVNSPWFTVTLPNLARVMSIWLILFISYGLGYFDSPCRQDHFMATRPVYLWRIFFAKSAIVGAMAIILGLAQTVVSISLGFGALPLLSYLILVLWAMNALFLGAFIKVSASHFVWWGISFVSFSGLLWLLIFLTKDMGGSFNEPALSYLLTVSLLCLLAAFEINRRKPQKARLIFTGVLSLGFTAVVIGTSLSPVTKLVSAEEFAESLKARKPIEVKLSASNNEFLMISPDYNIYANGRSDLLYVVPHDLKIVSESGRSLDLSKSQMRYMGRGGSYYREEVLPLLPYLNDWEKEQMLERANQQRSQSRMTEGFNVKIPTDFAGLNEKIHIAMTPRIHFRNLKEVGSIPFKKGEVLSTSDFMIKLADIRLMKRRKQEVEYRKTVFSYSVKSARNIKIVCLFSAKSTREVWIREFYINDELTVPGQTISRKEDWWVSERRGSSQITLIPEDATLRFFQYEISDKADLPEISTTTTLASLFNRQRGKSRADYVIRDSISGEPELPQLDSSGALNYLKKIEVFDYSRVNRSGLISSTVDSLAARDPEALLSYLDQPYAVSHVKSKILKALRYYGPDSIKEAALKLLKKDKSLIELVLERGWGKEARETILSAARAAKSRLSYNQNRALVYYNDEESLDLLLEFLPYGFEADAYYALLASPKHAAEAQKVYAKRESEYLERLRYQNIHELTQNELLFFLKTGSGKALSLVCERLSKGANRSSGLEWAVRDSTRTSDYVSPRRNHEASKQIVECVRKLKGKDIVFDQKRRVFILPFRSSHF